VSDAGLTGLRLDAAWPRPLRQQIIVPFLLLLVFVAVVGAAALTYQATGSGLAGLDQGLVRASVQANDALATLEAGRLNDLRTLAATPSLTTAVAQRNDTALSALFAADIGTAREAHVLIHIVDGEGHRLLSIPADEGRGTYGDVPAVRRILTGAIDARGDKDLALVVENSGQVVYWAAPIRDTTHKVIGAVLLGMSIGDLAAEISHTQARRLFFYGPTGRPLDPALTGLASLSPDVRQSVTADHLMRVSATTGGHSYAVAVSDWTMRGERLGYLGVGVPADRVVDNVFRLRVVLLFVFAGTALLVLVVGGLLARRITRPLEQLVSSIVAAGNHRAPTGRADEIGYLTSSFNEMTASLEEKTRALAATSFASIEALARAIDARDPYTYGHSARVARLSFEIAREMGLQPDELAALGRAALLHDIGKIGVEDRVLRKPGPLTKREVIAMRAHPVIGYEMLKGLHFLESSLTGIRHHHEHWDGTGYPDGLQGKDIPLAVRILTVADALDALTSDRPYRTARSFSAAVATLEAGAGVQFDPAVIRALLLHGAAVATLLTVMGKPRAMPSEMLKEPAV
jgi:putative nucleotidyltransferase with HDIG domain